MKEIKDFPNYLVTKDGNIYSKNYNRLLTPRDNGRGYLQVCLSNSEGTHWFLVSRLVAHAYLGLSLYDTTLEVDHKDTDTYNNKSSNLQILSKDAHLDKTLKSRGQSRRVRKTRPKPFNVDRKTLNNTLIECGSWTGAARVFNLSDNGLRKAYKRIFEVSQVPKIKNLKPM